MADAVEPDTPAHATIPPPVADDELLWRLLRPDWIVPSEKSGQAGPRVSSIAFKDGTNPERAVSVFRKAMMPPEMRAEQALTFEKAAELTAKTARDLGHEVRPDIEGGQHVAHAVIVPPHKGNNPWARDARKLAEAAVIVGVAPPAES